MISRHSSSSALLLLLVLTVSACSTQQTAPPRPASPLAPMGSMLAVERFLQAANTNDYQAMAGLFGNFQGPVEIERTQLELQMATIAEILRHDDYEIVSERPAIGREYPTNRVGVTLTKGGKVIRDVPFLVVQSSGGSWLVEVIPTERILAG